MNLQQVLSNVIRSAAGALWLISFSASTLMLHNGSSMLTNHSPAAQLKGVQVSGAMETLLGTGQVAHGLPVPQNTLCM